MGKRKDEPFETRKSAPGPFLFFLQRRRTLRALSV